jgi:hypothetical protein
MKKIHTVCRLGSNVRNADGVWRSIYLGDASLARSIFNPANERVYPSVLAYIGPNAHGGTSAHSLAPRGYFGVFWWVCGVLRSFGCTHFGSEDTSERSYPGPGRVPHQ